MGAPRVGKRSFCGESKPGAVSGHSGRGEGGGESVCGRGGAVIPPAQWSARCHAPGAGGTAG